MFSLYLTDSGYNLKRMIITIIKQSTHFYVLKYFYKETSFPCKFNILEMPPSFSIFSVAVNNGGNIKLRFIVWWRMFLFYFWQCYVIANSINTIATWWDLLIIVSYLFYVYFLLFVLWYWYVLDNLIKKLYVFS